MTIAMNTPPYNILFLCTGNSARSILAEGLVNHLSNGRFKGYSAGSQPMGRVNPLAIETLQQLGCDTSGMSSKSWDVFAGENAPKMDFVITVCDSAAGEACPYWPGTPMTAHWGFADPSHVEGDDETKRLAFAKTAQAIAHRLRLFLSLPMDKLDTLSLQRELRQIGTAG
ncbi:arsenate reductase ArsC [Thermomonas sp. HDW16]|uniref:arsenate reductase ArsC n=1 Tax=Thermomonas sp. HDW16 TaxID=2714945 RepID=UPI001F0EBBF4|nr:arsenate reductase ArsC [Thermomonas sp. HDW16]